MSLIRNVKSTLRDKAFPNKSSLAQKNCATTKPILTTFLWQTQKAIDFACVFHINSHFYEEHCTVCSGKKTTEKIWYRIRKIKSQKVFL